MTIDFNTRVDLYAGHITQTHDHEAEWSGTLGQFWFDNEGAYWSFETFQKALDVGVMHLGGGAEPEFTLVRT